MWALVTGGAKRLGADLCMALADQGYAVAVHYHQSREEALEVVEACQRLGVQAVAIQGDFSSPEGVKKFSLDYVEQYPETSVLINNVGDYLIRSALQTTVEEWVNLFQLNLHAPFILSQALAPSLIKSKGHIINIGQSGLKRNRAHVYAAASVLSKEGLWGLTLSLAREMAPYQVKGNMVSPGELENSVDKNEIPMERPAQCSEVCRVVNFLLDPQSGYITGQNIEVAGGLGLA